jgi:hypothetical protein
MILDFLIGLLLALLPTRIRERHMPAWHGNLRACALSSGIVQSVALLGILGSRYWYFMNYRLGSINEAAISKDAANAVGSIHVQFGMGMVSLLEFLLQPISILLIYFVFEGVVRVAASVVSGEVLGTLPILLLDKMVNAIQNRREKERLGERVPDVVALPPMEGSGYDLSVSSCRAKPSWDQFMTVSYQDKLYEICDYFEAAPPRRHVYLLRRAPVNKVIRGLHQYDPEEVMDS